MQDKATEYSLMSKIFKGKYPFNNWLRKPLNYEDFMIEVCLPICSFYQPTFFASLVHYRQQLLNFESFVEGSKVINYYYDDYVPI